MRYFLIYLFDSKEHFLSRSKCDTQIHSLNVMKCRIKAQMAYVLPWDLEVLSILAKPCVLNSTSHGWQRTYYVLDVLCRQQIKLFQVVSTSEFHEY